MDFKRRIIPRTILTHTNADLLSLIKNFINQKLHILGIQKAGLTDYNLQYPLKLAEHIRFCENIKKDFLASTANSARHRKNQQNDSGSSYRN